MSAELVNARVVPELPEGALVLWVIFERPADHPDHFVVRRQAASGGTMNDVVTEERPVGVVASLAAARSLVPEDLVMITRHPNDAPSVVEAWF